MPVATIAKLVNAQLKNGSSANLAVDGSGTPVVFNLGAVTAADIEVHTMCLIAEFSGSLAIGNKFLASAINTLTNGLLVEAKISDSDFTFGNLKRTREVLELSPSDNGPNLIVSGTYTLLQTFFYVPPFVRVCKQGTFGTDDYIKATVRDDLTGLYWMEIFVQGVMV